jgi:hypothetical protein
MRPAQIEGRIVKATIKAILETTEGVRLQVSFGSETALIYPWQIVLEDRYWDEELRRRGGWNGLCGHFGLLHCSSE